MSQFFVDTTVNPPPPVIPGNVAETYICDVGSAVPALNILNVVTPGAGTQGVLTTGSGSTITISVTGSGLTGSTTTIGAVTGNVITVSLGAIPGTYTFDVKISGFDKTTPAAAGFTIVGAVRTTGAAAVLLSGQAVDVFTDATTTTCTGTLIVSANTAIFQVLGTAGQTIDWVGEGEYIFSS